MLDAKMIRTGGNVIRFHTSNIIKSQDVAQHSYNCAMLIDMIASTDAFDDFISPLERYELVMYMLLHDVPEQHIGDIPGPSKKGNYGLAIDFEEGNWVIENFEERYRNIFIQEHMNSTQTLLCKFVDNLECLYKCREERSLGNLSMIDMIHKIKKYMKDSILDQYERGFLTSKQYDYLFYLIQKEDV